MDSNKGIQKHHTRRQSLGFTLAEVLTTLMVIGVVAALTIPSLINSYREQADIAMIKKANSIYSSFVKLLVAENMITSNSDAVNYYRANKDDCNFFGKYFKAATGIKKVQKSHCSFTTADGLIWDFYIATVDDKTYDTALLTKVYLPNKRNIKINGREVTTYEGKATNYFLFYFNVDGGNVWINNPEHTPWIKWKGSEWCGQHPFGYGCWNGFLEFTQDENLYNQFINKNYTQWTPYY